MESNKVLFNFEVKISRRLSFLINTYKTLLPSPIRRSSKTINHTISNRGLLSPVKMEQVGKWES